VESGGSVVQEGSGGSVVQEGVHRIAPTSVILTHFGSARVRPLSACAIGKIVSHVLDQMYHSFH
jgi:hypothetical protein